MKQLIEGIELIGRTKDDGFKKPLYLIRTSNKRYLQVSELLFQIIEAMKQEPSEAAVATRVSELQNKDIDVQAVRYVIEKKLEPLGIVTDTHVIFQRHTPTLPDPPDILRLLRFRLTILPAALVRIISFLFLPLFDKRVIVTVFAITVAVNVWLFGLHGISSSLQQTLYEPGYFMLIFGLIFASSLFHELGHATATMYGGAKPGRIGVGMYLIWPAFFTDITDVYRLGRWERLRSDFGGVYFNLVFACIICFVYFITRMEPLLLLILFQNLSVLHQLIPFVRLDGYFIVSDLVGIPDLFFRIKPILKNVFFRKQTAATKDLKTWVKLVVTLWVIVMVPLMGIVMGIMILSLPHIFLTAGNSATLQLTALIESIKQKEYMDSIIRIVQMIVFLFPALGALVLMYLLIKSVLFRLNAKMDTYINAGAK